MARVYLDNACTNLYDERVLACTEVLTDLFRDQVITAGDANRTLRGYYVKAREAAASLIHCDPSEIALVESTSQAFQVASSILPLKPESNVLVCDLEYQSSVLSFRRRQEDIGFEIHRVFSHDGKVDPEDYEACFDDNTVAVVVAAVQEINGFRMDIRKLAEIAHKHGAYILVDGIQEVGAMCVDVKHTGVDLYFAGGKKWLGNPFGMGFLYMAKEVQPLFKPTTYAYFHTDVPEEYHGDFITYLENPNRTPFDPFLLHKDASIYEVGGYGNYLGAMGLSKSIEILREYGIEKIEARIRILIRRLIDGLKQLPVVIASPTDEEHISPTASFNLGLIGGSKLEKKLETYLIDRRIYVSLRCCTNTGGIRVSVNYYNKEEEIDKLLAAVKQFIEENKVGMARR